MKSVFNQNDNKEFVERINSLKPDDQAKWGKMNVSQMMLHCTRPIHVSLGNKKLKRGLIGILFGGMAKKKLVGADQFGKNMPTDPSFIVKENPDFNSSKSELLSLVETLKTKGHAGLTTEPHPFFGKLTHPEWDALISKHLDHHLRQFGK